MDIIKLLLIVFFQGLGEGRGRVNSLFLHVSLVRVYVNNVLYTNTHPLNPVTLLSI